MRRHAKALPAGSTDGTGSSRAPSLRLIGLLAIAITALFAVSATSAFAFNKEVGSFAGGGPLAGGAGTADGQLQNPGQADVNDASGMLYVADTGNDRVEVFKPTESAGEYDSKATVAAPTGLAIDQASGDVYVANAAGIAKYDEDLNPIASGWTAPTATGNLAVDPSTGDLLVADTASDLIRRFEADGTAAGTFAAARPVDVAANSSGEVFVVTTTGNITGGEGACGPTSSVKRFSGAGVETGTVGPALELPGAVAVDPDDDSIMVAANVGEYACERGITPRVVYFEADGTPIQTVAMPNLAMYAMVPGLAVQGGGPDRVYAVTKSPVNDQYGPTKITVFEDVVAPEVVLDPVDFGANEATFSGSINPKGRAIDWHFEYSGDGGASWTSTPIETLPSGEVAVAVSATATGLEAKHAYQVKLVANEVTSSPQSFTTLAAAPQVETFGPANVSETGALLRGRVNPNNEATTYRFEIGETTAYGRTVPAGSQPSAGNGGAFTRVAATADSLSPGTTYHYRLAATNGTGTEHGLDETFTARNTAPACPNEALRAENRSLDLVGCRAYEMVSPADKVGSDVIIFNSTIRSSLDGDSVAFSSTGSFSGAEGSPTSVQYIGSREPGTWSSKGIAPPQVTNPSYTLSSNAYRGYTDDLSKGFLSVYPGVPGMATGAPSGLANLFSRDLSSGAYSLLNVVAPGLTEPSAFFSSPNFAGSSADGSHVVFESPLNFTPDASGTDVKAYEWVNGQVRLVGILPSSEGGGPATEGSMIGNGASGSSYGSLGGPSFNEGAISDDGSRIFFTTPQSNPFTPEPATPTQVYLREDGTNTVRVSAPTSGAPSEPTSGTRFWMATPDGRYVFFTSAQRLTSDSTAEVGASPSPRPDLYRYDAETGELTDVSVTATSSSAGVGNIYSAGEEEGGVLGISDDGTRVYYAARGQIVDGSPDIEGRLKLYRWDAGEGVTFIATMSPGDGTPWNQNNFSGTKESRISPDGRYLLFSSKANLDPGADGGGQKAVYLYDANGDELSCVSCPPDGSAGTMDATLGGAAAASGTVGGAIGAELFAFNYYLPRYLSDDGTAFFMTAQGLLPSDTNGVQDVYMWDDNRLSLISTGQSGTRSFFGDASPSGDDVFFATREQISNRDVDGNLDVYDARVDGGQPQPPPPNNGHCEGEACQGSAAVPAAAGAVATEAVSGAGNFHEARPRCIKPKKHKGKTKHKGKGQRKGKGATKSAGASKKKTKPCKRVAK